MPMIQPWELSQYQFAAEQMCQRLGVSPHEMTMDSTGMQVPRWVEYATRMHEHRVMLEAMRQAGVPLL